MSSQSTDGQSGSIFAGSGIAVDTLAMCAIAALAAKAHQSWQPTETEDLRHFCDALVHPDDNRRHYVLARLVGRGLSVEEIVERYIPEAARTLGDGWVNDTLSFAEVTIGASRLQETVRTYGYRYVERGQNDSLGHTLLMVTPEFEDHSLGIHVVAQRLRRNGFWAQMALRVSAEDLAELMQTHTFSAVCMSVAKGKELALVGNFVDTVRSVYRGSMPIFLGGTILDDLADARQAPKLSGVELLTNDLAEVTRYFEATANQVSSGRMKVSAGT